MDIFPARFELKSALSLRQLFLCRNIFNYIQARGVFSKEAYSEENEAICCFRLSTFNNIFFGPSLELIGLSQKSKWLSPQVFKKFNFEWILRAIHSGVSTQSGNSSIPLAARSIVSRAGWRRIDDIVSRLCVHSELTTMENRGIKSNAFIPTKMP